MRAGMVHAFGKPLTIEEIPIPTPRPGEVLIKVVASGVCHTDLHAAEGDWPAKPSLPFVPGHEGVGIIAACGSGVVGLKEGDHAGVAWLHDACGQCEYCMSGWDSLCYTQHNTGYGVNGSFAEYVIGAAPYVGRVPEKADFAEMAPICVGAQDGAPKGHHQPRRSTARGVSDAHPRRGHEPHYDSRLHCWGP
jgi:propanol-preferring alcohol dehydrogenase